MCPWVLTPSRHTCHSCRFHQPANDFTRFLQVDSEPQFPRLHWSGEVGLGGFSGLRKCPKHLQTQGD